MVIEIFSSGTHTDMYGRTRPWTPEEVTRIAETYNAEYPRHQAPAVLGHPQHDETGNCSAPAYGWAEHLTTRDEIRDGQPTRVLYAKFKQFYKPFLDAVKAGWWKNRSIYVDNWKLMHIGWLGKNLPAIPGLADPTEDTAMWATFAAGDTGAELLVQENYSYAEPAAVGGGVTTNNKTATTMDEQQFNSLMGLLQNVATGLSQLLQKAGIAPPAAAPAGGAPAPPPGGGGGGGFTAPVATPVAAPQVPEAGAAATPVTTTDPVATAAQAAERTADLQRMATLEAEIQEFKFAAFLDSDEIRARVTPKMRPQVLEMLRGLAVQQAATPAGMFAAGKSPLELYQESLKLLPVIAPVTGPHHFARLPVDNGGDAPEEDASAKEAEKIVKTRTRAA